MTDLTDEQIDRTASDARRAYVRGHVSYGSSAEAAAYRDIESGRRFDRWLAAVVARAKREERERIARELNAAANERDDTHNNSFVEGIRWAAGEFEVIA